MPAYRDKQFHTLLVTIEKTRVLLEQCIVARDKTRCVLPTAYDCRYVRLLDSRLLSLTHQLTLLRRYAIIFLAVIWNNNGYKNVVLDSIGLMSDQITKAGFYPYLHNRAIDAKLDLF